jgi:hypothetical protein
LFVFKFIRSEIRFFKFIVRFANGGPSPAVRKITLAAWVVTIIAGFALHLSTGTIIGILIALGFAGGVAGVVVGRRSGGRGHAGGRGAGALQGGYRMTGTPFQAPGSTAQGPGYEQPFGPGAQAGSPRGFDQPGYAGPSYGPQPSYDAQPQAYGAQPQAYGAQPQWADGSGAPTAQRAPSWNLDPRDPAMDQRPSGHAWNPDA